MNAHKRKMAIRDLIWGALVEKAKDRTSGTWEADERYVVATAANTAAVAYGAPGRVTVDDVKRVEGRAVGHSDYAPKLALYVAELVCGEVSE